MKLEIADEIEALSAHYIRPIRSAEEQSRWLADYLTDLGEFPLASVQSACRRWRQSDATKFPTPGQLRAMVRAATPSNQDPTANRPWTPLSDAEYERLTITEKVRHQKLLAMEAGRKAGPMWAGGARASVECMPARWHEWKAREANHYEEARRLQAILDRAREAS